MTVTKIIDFCNTLYKCCWPQHTPWRFCSRPAGHFRWPGVLHGIKISELISPDNGFLMMPWVFLECLGVYKSHTVGHWMQTFPNQWCFGFENRQNDAQIIKIAMFQVKTRLIEKECTQTGDGVGIRWVERLHENSRRLQGPKPSHPNRCFFVAAHVIVTRHRCVLWLVHCIQHWSICVPGTQFPCGPPCRARLDLVFWWVTQKSGTEPLIVLVDGWWY